MSAVRTKALSVLLNLAGGLMQKDHLSRDLEGEQLNMQAWQFLWTYMPHL